MMTVANNITLARILLIPVFVLFAIYYGQSVADGNPQKWMRMTAIAVFVAAAISDGLDGWVARRFKQRSKLGVVLDPIADKALLFSAIITLSVTEWAYKLPIWFAVLVITRDVVIVIGSLIVKHLTNHLEVKPSWMGKTATALQMVALSWVMLEIPHPQYSVYAAALFTLASGVEYCARGMRQTKEQVGTAGH